MKRLEMRRYEAEERYIRQRSLKAANVVGWLRAAVLIAAWSFVPLCLLCCLITPLARAIGLWLPLMPAVLAFGFIVLEID
jgi:hypothetical protein